jgi:hypothetical protein
MNKIPIHRHELRKVKVVKGLNIGRVGFVVSNPWIGNLWNLLLTINVPATKQEIVRVYNDGWQNQIGELLQNAKEGHGPRYWISVWRWQVTDVN